MGLPGRIGLITGTNRLKEEEPLGSKALGGQGCDSGGRKELAGNSPTHARTPPAARTQEFGRKQQEDVSLMIFISTFETGSHVSQTDPRLTL